MKSKEAIIKNASGLNSKPAAMFINKAGSFKSSIWVEKGERKANAKSLLGLLSLGIGKGVKVVITADGEDEEKAVNELVEYIGEGLGEELK